VLPDDCEVAQAGPLNTHSTWIPP